jgi:hypothetical protein
MVLGLVGFFGIHQEPRLEPGVDRGNRGVSTTPNQGVLVPGGGVVILLGGRVV